MDWSSIIIIRPLKSFPRRKKESSQFQDGRSQHHSRQLQQTVHETWADQQSGKYPKQTSELFRISSSCNERWSWSYWKTLQSYSSNNLKITRNSSISHGDRSTNISKDPKDVIKNYKHSNVNSESNPVSVASFRQFLDDLAWHESWELRFPAQHT